MNEQHPVPGQPADAPPAQRFAAHYPALRRMARARLRQHETFTLLDTTALVHESFLRLSRTAGLKSEETPAFLAYAGHVMRSVIVDAARQRLAQCRGEGRKAEPLDEELLDALSSKPAQVIVDLHDALLVLEQTEPRQARVIELHYFGGFTEVEMAMALGLSESTIRRDLRQALTLLRAMLG